MQELFVSIFLFSELFFSCGKNKAFLNWAHSLLASSPSLYELFCMSFSGFVYHPQQTQKKCKHMKQNFLFSQLMEHGRGISQAGAWRVLVVCEQELVVFSLVFESWFSQLPF